MFSLSLSLKKEKCFLLLDLVFLRFHLSFSLFLAPLFLSLLSILLSSSHFGFVPFPTSCPRVFLFSLFSLSLLSPPTPSLFLRVCVQFSRFI